MQEQKIIELLMNNLDELKIKNLCNFLSHILYSDDKYCLINILLGFEHKFYNKGDVIFCLIENWTVDKIENIDFCLNHGFLVQQENNFYIRSVVKRNCEYKATIYVDFYICDIDGNPVPHDTDRSVSRDKILKQLK